MHKVPTVFLALVLLSVSSACHYARIETEAKPSLVTIEEPFAHGWILGLVPPKLVSTANKCPHGVAKVETKISFLNGFVRCLTFGIYTPMWIKVTCAEPGAAQVRTSGRDILVGSSAGVAGYGCRRGPDARRWSKNLITSGSSMKS